MTKNFTPEQDKSPGYKKRFREQFLPRVLELSRGGWVGCREVARRVSREAGQTVSHMTVYRWRNMGQEARGNKANKGGRPVKGRDKYREKWEPLARQLREQGMGWRTIAKEISQRAGRTISHTGVRRWLMS